MRSADRSTCESVLGKRSGVAQSDGNGERSHASTHSAVRVYLSRDVKQEMGELHGWIEDSQKCGRSQASLHSIRALSIVLIANSLMSRL